MENSTYKQDLIAEYKEKYGALTEHEKEFLEKVEEVKQMEDVEPYEIDWVQIMLIRKLYKNNYLDAAGNEFYYGFYQGMQYMKNRQKKQKGAAG